MKSLNVWLFVAGKPFLWYLLKYLTRYDVNRVVLSVGYLREVIYKWVDEMKKDFSFEFDYAVEEEPLGTVEVLNWLLVNANLMMW